MGELPQPDVTVPPQPDAYAASSGAARPSVSSLTMQAFRNARFLLLFDLVGFGLLAIASPRPTFQPSATPTAAGAAGFFFAVLVWGLSSARWAAGKGASGEVRIGFAVVVNVLLLAAIVGFLAFWGFAGAPPGASWMDSVAPRISESEDPVGEVVLSCIVALCVVNVAVSAVSEYRRWKVR
jgi:hypothetical protein